CTQIEQQQLLADRFLTPSDFYHSHNRLNKRRTKLHCSEISKKLFPEYHGRISTEWTCSNVDLFIELTREYEAWQKINRRLVERKQAQKAKITNNIKYIWNSAYPTYVSRCLTLRAHCLAFMQIRPLEY
ncbi:hypothetical protein T06_4888, partial [Trichinella sp. T6]